MKIKKTLSKLVSFDDRESKYIYRIIENTVKNRQAFGIEIERQDLNCGEVINLERHTINIVCVKGRLIKLFNQSSLHAYYKYSSKQWEKSRRYFSIII